MKLESKIVLPDVTLVAIDTACHNLTWMAVDECLSHAIFGDVKVFMNWKGQRESFYIDKFNSTAEGLNFLVFELPKHIKTSHVLFIQWDSWIIDQQMWTPEFLEYDWIGAPWWYAERNVGNSGFCLQSKKLMEFFAEQAETFPLNKSYDHLICREYQPKLPGFKWAPESLASQFSFERSRPKIDSRHFGFHGIFNWPFIMPPAKVSERMKLVRQNSYLKRSGAIEQIERISSVWHKLQGDKDGTNELD